MLFHGSLFSWKRNHGLCEASDLPRTFDFRSFQVKGNRLTKTFYLSQVKRSQEEILAWEYYSPGSEIVITILND